MFSISQKGGPDKKSVETSLSLFNGGVLVDVTKKMHMSVFSTSAVAEIDSGLLAAIVDGKIRETGVLALGNKAVVRSISQQKGKELSLGNTTIVLPGRDPSPSLYITFRHVAVLKHFFGDKSISDQMQSSAITPTNDQDATNKVKR
jgi:hypothetical protein